MNIQDRITKVTLEWSSASMEPPVVVPSTSPSLVAEPPEPGVTYDNTRGTGKSEVGRSEEEWRVFDYQLDLNHRVKPNRQAADALRTLDDHLSRIDRSIALLRPDLAGSKWDFTMKDGRFVVDPASMSKDDAAWIENRLNGDLILRTAAQSIVGSAVAYLETSDESPAYIGNNLHTGRTMRYHFADVAEQLNGTLAFRDLLSSAREAGDGRLDSPSLGYDALEILASRLKPVDLPTAPAKSTATPG